VAGKRICSGSMRRRAGRKGEHDEVERDSMQSFGDATKANG